MDPKKLPALAGWEHLPRSQRSLMLVLVEIKKAFCKPEFRKLQQPAEGANY